MSDVFDFSTLFTGLWTNRVRASAILFTSVVVGVVVSVLWPPAYLGSATLSPAPQDREGPNLSGALASIGGQLGLSLGGSATVQLRFYPRLVHSSWFLTRLAQTQVRPDTTLIEVLTREPMPHDTAERQRRMDEVTRRLAKRVHVALDDRANVFSIEVRMPSRAVAEAAITHAVELLTEFDTNVRRSRASVYRRFVDERADSARRNLAAAEDSLTSFLARNRTYEQSPELRLAYQRLDRRVALRQEVYITLTRALEQARLDESRDAPVLTVVDPPRVQWQRIEPRRRQIVLIVSGIGVVLVALLELVPAGMLRIGRDRA